ncbi:hypothetical protein ELG71_08255 [Rhizobium leguminosarum]|uniref:hypothetical protein n=1 Tax=Rhizobium leguminosarum TaxID=384 RepID=UPI001030F502|nr:hypothetical protein [Rhizobium leguminosarum]TBG58345.1 hypothetical protein ELG71_08255 [Rhizobium leguminosarum]
MSTLPTEAEFNKWRDEVLLSNAGIKGVGTIPWEQLRKIELFPGSPLGSEKIVVPEHYLPPGARRRKSFRTRIPDLGGRLMQGAAPLVAQNRHEWVRRALLAIWLPHNLTVAKQGYSPSTWLSKTKVFLRWLASVVDELGQEEHDLWRLVLDDSRSGFSRHTKSEALRGDLQRTVQILLDAAANNIMPPPPKSTLETGFRTYTYKSGAGATTEATRLEKAKKLAFPDEFVARVLWIIIWLQENLSEQAIQCWQSTEAINNSDPADRGSLSAATHAARDAVVRNYDWRDKNGAPIVELPFEIFQRCGASSYSPSSEWPPRTYSTIPLLINVIQALNASTAAFCSAARLHEVSGASCPTDETEREQVLKSTTYKFAGTLGGEKRNWPLHPFAIRALEIQAKLSSVVKPTGADYLWVQTRNSSTGNRGDPLLDISVATVEAIKNLDLTKFSEGRPHYHRWRHTIARLIGLTVEEAIEVIQDIFGHEDVEMSIHYMLSDPEIVEWAIQVSKDVAIALAEEAIKEVEAGKAGGTAAARIADSMIGYKMRRGIEALGTDDINEAAHFLTLNGVAFQRVKRGILCTKAPGEFGKCTKGRGKPDAGACQSDCMHRLELALEQAQCRDEIMYLLAAHQIANADGEIMKVARLEGQILSELKRWDVVREEILLQFDNALTIWAGAGHAEP